MKNINRKYFTPALEWTRELAEKRMQEEGHSDFQFTGHSYSNGASFYFELGSGQKVRVSDHALAGNRAFEYIQIEFSPVKTMSAKR